MSSGVCGHNHNHAISALWPLLHPTKKANSSSTAEQHASSEPSVWLAAAAPEVAFRGSSLSDPPGRSNDDFVDPLAGTNVPGVVP